MWCAASLTALVSAVILHSLCVRLAPGLNRVISFFAVGGVLGVGLVVFGSSIYGFMSFETLAAVLFYAFACELYVFLFTLSLSSISANLLARLHHGRMTSGEVDRLYDSRRMVANRVARLLDSGLLQVDDGSIRVATKGHKLLRILASMRVFFGHDVNGGA